MNYTLNTKLKAENLSGKKYVSEIELQIEIFSEKSLLVFGWVGVERPFYVMSDYGEVCFICATFYQFLKYNVFFRKKILFF